ncbi:tetratricopeptide repeat protein [Streptococcus ruminantium]|uniref:tetratricopeptide repeat protein n=1 Tax=Streptococcus ruminantium TaxID=1917441 RepID=UPI001F21C21B|nr:tetratricopeptide repeat protein [Streptococcus ruminantium]
MMREKIARLIQNKRKEKGWTQKKLSEGICTQALISKIEKAKVSTSVELFDALVKKLKIDPYYVQEVFQENMEGSNRFYTAEIRNLLYKRDYDTLAYIIKVTNKNQVTRQEREYFKYMQAMIYYGKQGDVQEAIEEFFTLFHEAEDEVLRLRAGTMLGTLYSEIGKFEEAISIFESILPHYRQAFEIQQQLHFLYGFSRTLVLAERYDEALIHGNQSLNLQREHHSLYLLGHTLLLRANILYAKGLPREALSVLEQAIAVYQIENDDLVRIAAESMREQIKGELK